jgi:hypothetical protein
MIICRTILIVALFFFALCGSAHSNETLDKNMYFGADAVACKMCFKEEAGGNLFKKNSIGCNPFVGISVNDYVSVEAGYQYIGSTRVGVLQTGDQVGRNVVINQPMSPVTYKSSFVIKGPHVNIFLKSQKLLKTPISVFMGIGLSESRARFERKTIQFTNIVGFRTRVFEKSKTLKRLTFGANYEVSDNMSCRITAVVMDTRKLHAYPNDGTYSLYVSEIIPKNIICYSAGLKWKF